MLFKSPSLDLKRPSTPPLTPHPLEISHSFDPSFLLSCLLRPLLALSARLSVCLFACQCLVKSWLLWLRYSVALATAAYLSLRAALLEHQQHQQPLSLLPPPIPRVIFAMRTGYQEPSSKTELGMSDYHCDLMTVSKY